LPGTAGASSGSHTNPRHPKIVLRTELPHQQMRSNSLEVCGDAMAVAYQISAPRIEPAGLERLDIAKPEEPPERAEHQSIPPARPEFCRSDRFCRVNGYALAVPRYN